MSADRIERALQAAIAEGTVPAAARLPAQDSRPWPVVLLTGLGAWLAAVPLLGVAGLLFGDLLRRGGGPYIVGMLALAAAILVLRRRDLPLFVEQLAIPALLVGAVELGLGVFRDLHAQAGAAVMALLVVAVAAIVAQAWLRVLLGAVAATLIAIACASDPPSGAYVPTPTRFWLAWHVSLLLWLLVGVVQRHWFNDGAQARRAAMLESLSAGWLLATLAGLAWWSGMTFLAGASLGGGLFGEVSRELGAGSSVVPELPWLRAASLILAVGAALWAGSRWPTLRRPPMAGVAAVLVALAWFMPSLGAVLLALALCVTNSRWRLAAAAALAAAWIVGSFYYALAWPLSTKALVLVACGAVLGALAWLAARADGDTQALPLATPLAPVHPWANAGVALSLLAVLVVANVGIWQKEDLIARGVPVYVELAPADPRSLMQGDYMRLNFRVPGNAQESTAGLLTNRRPHVVARRGANGVATLLRIDDGSALAADEMRIELTPKNGRWTVVSDAWFFKEGEAERWADAKYGEFRVDANGHALLVGLRGKNLEAL